MKKIIRLLTLALLTVPVTTFAQSEGNQNTSELAGKVVASKPDSLLDWETPHDPTCPQVLLETTMGNILVALYNDTPKHRDNFLKLVNSGYYDGCIFQRVIKNFMIQGGDYSCRKVNMKKPQKFDVNSIRFRQKSSILNIIISADSSVLLAKEMMKIRPKLRRLLISTSPGAEIFLPGRWNIM